MSGTCGTTCVVGVGTTAYGKFPETDAYGLAVDALQVALDDCGLHMDDIDGLIVHRLTSYERFGEMIGLNPRYSLTLPSQGRFSSIAVMAGAQALATGQASMVALVYGNDGGSARQAYGGGPGLWAPWGMTSPGALHAMLYRRYAAQYGTRPEQLARVPITFRDHACRNPGAVMRKPISLAEYLGARFIAEPLRLFDYCIINDGGVAMIMTTADRARDLPRVPVSVRAFARQDTYVGASVLPEDYWFGALQAIAEQIYPAADIGRDDVDALMIYDNFAPTVLFALEGMGFCSRGEAGAFVAEGHLALGSRWPANTNGGHLSESYMQGWGLLAEAVRQIRGECGDRQVAACRTVQYICATNCATSIIFSA